MAYLHTLITFVPRHDLVQYAYEIGKSVIDLSYSPADSLLLDFHLSGNPGFVFALMSKLHMKDLRKERFDLVGLTDCKPAVFLLRVADSLYALDLLRQIGHEPPATRDNCDDGRVE